MEENERKPVVGMIGSPSAVKNLPVILVLANPADKDTRAFTCPATLAKKNGFISDDVAASDWKVLRWFSGIIDQNEGKWYQA